MKIGLAQLNYTIGNFNTNERNIIEHISKAKSLGADLVVFSELAVCGYPPRDLLERQEFILKVIKSLENIQKYTYGIGVVVGAPCLNTNEKGKNLYNTAYFIYDGEIVHTQHKTLLPDYDIFDECRYFEANTDFKTFTFRGKRIALTVCEDLWIQQPKRNNFSKSKLYTLSPIAKLIEESPDFIINIAASPFSYSQDDTRTEVLSNICEKYNLPLIYVNQVGANAELVFDGDSRVFDRNGDIKLQMESFREDFQLFDLSQVSNMPSISDYKTDNLELTHNALVLGVKDYFKKTGFKKAVVGLSGGIDSAVTLVIAQRALGSENTHALLMPSEYSSDHSITDAVALAKNLNISYDIINIQESFNILEDTMHVVFKGLPFDVTEENIQARLRGLILMAYSNKFGHLLLNTSNKSEMAVGYGTLYGDMNGGLSVLGDVYKTKVFDLAWYMNKGREIIPKHTITKPPSAELRPNQKDSDSLPDYEILDNILCSYIEKNLSLEDIVSKGLDENIVRRVLRMVDKNEYKRFQAPPILRVTTKSFGFGRKIPLVAKF